VVAVASTTCEGVQLSEAENEIAKTDQAHQVAPETVQISTSIREKLEGSLAHETGRRYRIVYSVTPDKQIHCMHPLQGCYAQASDQARTCDLS